ncbi:MAG: YbhB/YbcL family Raf kinase inhibitor-like protein [bacterium]|nr:YbhB/YbcL family Raf kinase inhibitor-like protein [bacterium]
MKITSSAFAHNGEMPSKFTCEGENVSPPLTWSGIPESAKSLVLIVDDPDAPDPAKPLRTWVHWLLYNIPATATGLIENASLPELPTGTLTGTNDRGSQAYHGPCPPIGRHRYFFKLYALDIVLPDLKQPNKADLVRAMDGHVVANCELIGTYQKQK